MLAPAGFSLHTSQTRASRITSWRAFVTRAFSATFTFFIITHKLLIVYQSIQLLTNHLNQHSFLQNYINNLLAVQQAFLLPDSYVYNLLFHLKNDLCIFLLDGFHLARI